MPLALIGVEDLVTALIILASAIYVAVCIVRKIFVIDYDDRLSFLSLAVKALIASVFPIFLFIWDFEKLPRFVPFVLTLAISTLLLTQALRHDPKVFSQRRFRTASLLVTAGLLAHYPDHQFPGIFTAGRDDSRVDLRMDYRSHHPRLLLCSRRAGLFDFPSSQRLVCFPS